MNFCRTMLLARSDFDYRAFVKEGFLGVNSAFVTLAKTTYRVDKALLATWGNRDCDVVRLLEDYLRQMENEGKTPSEQQAMEQLQKKLYPSLLAFHPLQSDIWEKFFSCL